MNSNRPGWVRGFVWNVSVIFIVTGLLSILRARWGTKGEMGKLKDAFAPLLSDCGPTNELSSRRAMRDCWTSCFFYVR